MTTSTPLATLTVTSGTLTVDVADGYVADHLWQERESLLKIADAQRLRLRFGSDVDLWWYGKPLPRRRSRVGWV